MRPLLARIDRLAFAQRVALILGIEAALVVVGAALTLPSRSPRGGWFGYAPNTSVTLSPGEDLGLWVLYDTGAGRLVAALIWLALIALGTAVAIRLLRSTESS